MVQLPSSFRKTARSARTQPETRRSSSGAAAAAPREPPTTSMASAPCPAAGRQISRGRISVTCSASPSRLRPASASTTASSSKARCRRVCTLPRIGTISRSGRCASIWTARRTELVPTRARCGRFSKLRARGAMSASRASSRIGKAQSWNPRGSSNGTSLALWTARSMRPSASASSSSLTKRPLPPTSASARSWMRSPVVEMRTSSATVPRRARSACTVSACQSASGLLRVPILSRLTRAFAEYPAPREGAAPPARRARQPPRSGDRRLRRAAARWARAGAC